MSSAKIRSMLWKCGSGSSSSFPFCGPAAPCVPAANRRARSDHDRPSRRGYTRPAQRSVDVSERQVGMCTSGPALTRISGRGFKISEFMAFWTWSRCANAAASSLSCDPPAKRREDDLNLSVRTLLSQLAGIRHTVLPHPSTSGRPRAHRRLTQMTPTQQRRHDAFDLGRHAPTPDHRLGSCTQPSLRPRLT